MLTFVSATRKITKISLYDSDIAIRIQKPATTIKEYSFAIHEIYILSLFNVSMIKEYDSEANSESKKSSVVCHP